MALKNFDQGGILSAKDMAEKIKRLQISQSPGIAAIQVMTIHKSKGLGFDVVIIPDLSNHKIPSFKHYESIISDTWICQAPPFWVREMLPELKSEENLWVKKQTYEAFCRLYVAMTRAKRGLYAFLTPQKNDAPQERATYAHWVIQSLSMNKDQPCYELGNPDWTKDLAPKQQRQIHSPLTLGKAVPKRKRQSPSSHELDSSSNSAFSRKAASAGTLWHKALETFTWCDDAKAPAFPTAFTPQLETMLAAPEIRHFFSKRGRNIELRHEQKFEAILDSRWISGIIDRIHIHFSNDGEATELEIIDFKSDPFLKLSELPESYRNQLHLYGRAMEQLYPKAQIHCFILSNAIPALIKVS